MGTLHFLFLLGLFFSSTFDKSLTHLKGENVMSEKSEIMKQLKDIKLTKLRIKMDLSTLNMIIKFIYKASVLRTRKSLKNIKTLMENLDMSIYEESSNSQELLNRIWIIETSLRGNLDEGLTSNDMMKKYCYDSPDCTDYIKEIMQSVIDDSPSITYDESKYLVKQIDDRLNFGYTITLKDIITQLFELLDESDSRSYKGIQEDLYQIATSIIAIKRNSTSIGSEETFSLSNDVFQTVVSDALDRLKDRNRIFVTGIRRWNTILSPGYMSKRLYTYLAFPGGGKSQILLKSALDIRKYNTFVKPKNPDKRPAVLFITMENSIEETVERIFNMTSSSDDIRNFTTRQVIKKLKSEGGLALTDKNNIDIIIRYFDNRSIDTNDLYGIIQDLEDEGIEVVTLILDYLKRIRPAEKGLSEKEELKNITNELKSLANYFDIPVITAQQLNRVAASVVDAAIQARKEDVTRLVGRDGVAGAWEIIENSDVVIIINQETKIDTGENYMTFKLLKRRYRSSETSEKLRKLEYFNHPYDPDNGIRLIDDLEAPKSISLTSLATQFAGAEDASKRGKKHAVDREIKEDKKTKEKSGYNVEFEPFDFGNHNY